MIFTQNSVDTPDGVEANENELDEPVAPPQTPGQVPPQEPSTGPAASKETSYSAEENKSEKPAPVAEEHKKKEKVMS